MAANRSAIVLLLCLVCAGSSFAQASKATVRHHKVEDPAGAALARGEAAMDRKDYAAAETALQQAVKTDAANFRAWFDLGVVYTALGRNDEAVAAYRKSVAADPTVFETNLNLGLMLARAGDPEAEKFLRAATQLKPSAHVNEGLARAWLSLGRLLENSNPARALDAFHHAGELAPKDAEPHLSAAMLAEKRQDFAAAEQEYKAAAERDPKSSEAVAGLANVYMQTQRMPEAESALRKYLALHPDSANGHLQLARVLAKQGKNSDALPELETVRRLSPGDAEAQRELTAIYFANKQYDKAAQLLAVAVQKNPGDAALHAQYGNVLMQQRRFQEAQHELLRAIQLKPDQGEIYGDLALVASENKDYPLAIKALEARARLQPETPGTLFLRATSYDHLRQYKLAAACYHEFLQASNGKFPDQEWQARHRLIAIEPKK
ncbi:MAG: tetratricopeptide repeat protein [Terriglobales bacterium]